MQNSYLFLHFVEWLVWITEIHDVYPTFLHSTGNYLRNMCPKFASFYNNCLNTNHRIYQSFFCWEISLKFSSYFNFIAEYKCDLLSCYLTQSTEDARFDVIDVFKARSAFSKQLCPLSSVLCVSVTLFCMGNPYLCFWAIYFHKYFLSVGFFLT